MKVIVCPSDASGCGSYRMIWPAMALQQLGYDVKLMKRPKIILDRRENPARVLDVSIPETDVMVFQRPGSYQVSQLISILHDKGVKVVIDMDDDLSCIHPSNPAYVAYEPQRNPNRNWDLIADACKMADFVTTTTPAIAERYGTPGKTAVLPNCIPEKFLTIGAEKHELITVGWAGWVATHPEDLQVTHGAVNQALSKKDARFLAIGDQKTLDRLSIRNRPPHSWQKGVPIQDYPAALAQLDIGIVPLADTPFNHAKSWLKALEYASVGVAPVVTPTYDNMRMVEAGAAYAAHSPGEWLSHLNRLITDGGERKALADRAREFAATQTIEGNALRWWDVWGQI